jgi:hypothetical protein
MNLIAFDGLPLWELPPEALYMLLFALSYGPIRLIWWRDYRLTSEKWIPTLREGFLPFALLALIVIRAPGSSDAWYSTWWWHLACLVAAFIGAAWLQKVRLRGGEVTIGGRRDGAELVQTAVYAFFAYWVLALMPFIIVESGPIWAGPVYALLLGALIALAWDHKPILRLADWLENYEVVRS